MIRPFSVLALGFLSSALLATSAAGAARCDNPQTNAEVAACLEEELRDSDVKINQTYQAIMRQLDDAKKRVLRTEQRAWLKKRDAACELDSKETNRERWLQALLKDYTKTVCVVRFTRTRGAELDQMLAARAAPAPSPAPAPAPAAPPTLEDNDQYEVVAPIRRSRGKRSTSTRMAHGSAECRAVRGGWMSSWAASTGPS